MGRYRPDGNPARHDVQKAVKARKYFIRQWQCLLKQSRRLAAFLSAPFKRFAAGERIKYALPQKRAFFGNGNHGIFHASSVPFRNIVVKCRSYSFDKS